MNIKTIILRIIRALCAIFSCFFFLQLPEEFINIDNWLGNWREALFSERAKTQSQDISIVEVNEKTLAQYAYQTPIPRDYLSKIIKNLDTAQPKSIILDIIFDKRSEKAKDEELIQTIKSAKTPIYIACNDSLQKNDFQSDFILRSGAKCAYPNFSSSVNKMLVNQIPKSTNESIKCSLSSVVKADNCFEYSKNDMRIDWLLPPKTGETIFPIFDANMIEGLIEAPFNRFTARHIFIGGNFENIDKHRTSIDIFKKDKNETNGVYIHAIAAQQIIDGRKVIELSSFYINLLIIAFAIIGSFSIENIKISQNPELFLFLTLSIGIILDLFLYKTFKFIFPQEYIIFSLDIGFLIAIWFDNIKNRLLNLMK